MGGSRVPGVGVALPTDCRAASGGDWDALQPRLAALSEQECAVLRMRIFGSLPQSEIADLLGITRRQVYRLLATSLARLRD